MYFYVREHCICTVKSVPDHFATLAVLKPCLVSNWPVHFKTYLNRVNGAVFFDIDLCTLGFNSFLIVLYVCLFFQHI